MSYNLHDEPLSNPLGEIVKLDLDAIALQEMRIDNESEVRKISEILQMNYFNVSGYNSSFYGIMIFTKWPIIEQSWIPLKIIDGPTPRAMLLTVVDTPLGQISIVATHFNTPNFIFTRSNQAEQVIDYLKNYSKIVLMGDFNTFPSFLDPAYVKLTKSFNDIWIDSNNTSFKGNTWNTKVPVFRVDYIFYRGLNIPVNSSVQRIKFEYYSDHMALVASLTTA